MSRTKKNTPAYRTKMRLEMEARSGSAEKKPKAAKVPTEAHATPNEEAEAPDEDGEDGEELDQAAQGTDVSEPTKAPKVSKCTGCGAVGHPTKKCPLEGDPEAQQKSLDAVKAAGLLRKKEHRHAKKEEKQRKQLLRAEAKKANKAKKRADKKAVLSKSQEKAPGADATQEGGNRASENKRKRQAEEGGIEGAATSAQIKAEQAEEHPRKKTALDGDLPHRDKHTDEDQDMLATAS